MKTTMKFILFSLLITLSTVNFAIAVGSGSLTNPFLSARALGSGNAFVASADDPSASYFNPAGLTQIAHPAFTLGISPISFSSEFKPDSGASEKIEDELPITPYVYGSIPFLSGKWAVGLGITYPYGLKTRWSDSGQLRYITTESELNVMQINPNVAYQINEKISLGAGFSVSKTNALLKSKVNQSVLNTAFTLTPTVSADGQKELTGSGMGFGYNLGILYKPLTEHQFGISYRSRMMTRVKGHLELSQLNGATESVFGGSKYKVESETDLNLPENLILGYGFKHRSFLFEFSAEWIDYSSIGENFISYKNETNPIRLTVLNDGNPIKRNWQSSWNFGLGANYQINETWQARTGYFHYAQVIPEHTWEPSIPDSAANGLTWGGSFNFKSITVDMAYAYMFFEKRTIHNSIGQTSAASINGQYSSNMHILSLGLTYNFGK